jgi:ABC-type antimicrobial peptide transport system permease subunit
MALGADRAAVLRMVLQQGIVLATVGLVVGLLASVGTGELLAGTFTGGDKTRDFTSLLLIAPVVLAVTAFAAYIPARRASRLDPMKALRYE